MNNFLAIDTGLKYLTVMAVKEGQTFYSHLPDCAMKHSVLLMEEVDKVLKQADLSPAECDFFAAVVGPGSFTGIRIGISTIKGFCLAAGKPSLPVTSFETMAYNDVDGNKLLCLVDALHGRYYACGYETASYDGSPRLPAAALREIFPPSYLEEAEVLRLVSEENYLPCAFERLPLADKTQVRLLDPVAGLRDSILALMRSEENFGELKAVYIRKSQAEEQLGV